MWISLVFSNQLLSHYTIFFIFLRIETNKMDPRQMDRSPRSKLCLLLVASAHCTILIRKLHSSLFHLLVHH